ncbi:OmpA family protein [Caldimonas brevitalea]|uniref:Cell envelope biogenesis protein OmpA n=1 Tax=Caldimonas brevitalea TaxID=413882 RepID=A0A0G3BMF8_9BURK|nr:OmpA family protein [Caldimonas brevitalea]AKJ28541.1 cell envelope biogenesis protein OmpA [Caldimonas brevitalea]
MTQITPTTAFLRPLYAALLTGALLPVGALAQQQQQPSQQAAPALITGPGAAPNQVVASGTVPDEATRAVVLARLRELYGSDRVVDQIQVGAVVAPPNWSNYVQKVLSPDLKQVTRGQLAIQGNNIDLKGEVANEAQRQQIASTMATSLNPTYTIRNGLRVAASEQNLVDDALANRIIEFEAGSSVLKPEGVKILDEMVPALAKVAARKIEIIGHTDAQGARDANIALSFARADAVKEYLRSKGIDAARINVSGAGPDRPVASNQTPDGRARNRRIEFRVSQ